MNYGGGGAFRHQARRHMVARPDIGKPHTLVKIPGPQARLGDDREDSAGAVAPHRSVMVSWFSRSDTTTGNDGGTKASSA